MKRKIFFNMCILSLITILLTSLMLSVVMYKESYELMKMEVGNEASYIAAALNHADTDFLATVHGTSNRITLIGGDGTVLFDSEIEADDMENHRDRPEVLDALESGIGRAVRTSSTLDNRTYYHAVGLNDGRILRVASNVGSVFLSLQSAAYIILLIIILTFFIAMQLAKAQTRKIIVPINNIDLENPMYNDVYEELAPLLTRINKQNLLIHNQFQDIRHKQEELSTITENMQEGLIVLDTRSSVLYINQSAKRIFNVKSNDYLRKHILSLSRNTSLRAAAEKVAADGSCEEILSVEDRKYRVIGDSFKVDGEIRGITLLVLDVTERFAAEQMRREFSANVSHELKTPLTAISGYAEIMKDGLVKAEDMSDFAGRIYSEAGRLIALIQDIIKISQLDEDGYEMQWEDIDLLELSHDVAQRLREKAQTRRIKVTVEGERKEIRGVKQIIDEMIFNLCENAIKYNHDEGKVNISVSGDENTAVLAVSDTGIGIPREHQSRVFERFYRVDKSHSKETGGTGLGLSIVKHGAHYHHADIKLESYPGKGTTIKLIFIL